jgi:hypothetical protein
MLVALIVPRLYAEETEPQTIEVRQLYRSNANGLSLVPIEQDQRRDFKFVLDVRSLQSGPEDDPLVLPKRKRLYEDGREIKRWDYIYSDSVLIREKYYKSGQIAEEYRYNSRGHKTTQIDYKNRKRIRTTSYQYNKNGLVDYEEVYNVLRKQVTKLFYKYDKNFRIKQIEKRYPDGRVVYWEAFFSQIGIILKEYYTLEDEIFTFLYDMNGQETGGEVKEITRQENEETIETVKLEWENFYSETGKKERKVEQNYSLDKKIETWFNQNGNEIQIETSFGGSVESIEKFAYDDENRIVNYKKIEDLFLSEVDYEYDEKRLVKRLEYENSDLKKITRFNEDGSRVEVLIAANNRRIMIEYDAEDNIVSQREYN